MLLQTVTDGMVGDATDEAQERTTVAGLLNEASVKLEDANKLVEQGDEEQAMMAVEKCMEDLREAVAEHDIGKENAPLWEISRGDVESYVGCELVDVAFSELGSAAVLVFEREDGDLHGFKLTPRESVKVCDIEVA